MGDRDTSMSAAKHGAVLAICHWIICYTYILNWGLGGEGWLRIHSVSITHLS